MTIGAQVAKAQPPPGVAAGVRTTVHWRRAYTPRACAENSSQSIFVCPGNPTEFFEQIKTGLDWGDQGAGAGCRQPPVYRIGLSAGTIRVWHDPPPGGTRSISHGLNNSETPSI